MIEEDDRVLRELDLPPNRRLAEVLVAVVTASRDHNRQIFLIMGMRLAINTTFYVATVFALSYGDDQLGIPKGQLLAGLLITSALGFVCDLPRIHRAQGMDGAKAHEALVRRVVVRTQGPRIKYMMDGDVLEHPGSEMTLRMICPVMSW